MREAIHWADRAKDFERHEISNRVFPVLLSLVENNEEFHVPEDLYNLVVKAIRIRKHLDINPHDIHNKRSLQNIEAKIRRLAKYYRSNNVLPSDWKYKPETAEMLITR